MISFYSLKVQSSSHKEAQESQKRFQITFWLYVPFVAYRSKSHAVKNYVI